METIDKTVLEVDVRQGLKNIDELISRMNVLKKSLNDGNMTIKEFTATMSKLKDAAEGMKGLAETLSTFDSKLSAGSADMTAFTSSMNDVADAANDAVGSIESINSQLDELSAKIGSMQTDVQFSIDMQTTGSMEFDADIINEFKAAIDRLDIDELKDKYEKLNEIIGELKLSLRDLNAPDAKAVEGTIRNLEKALDEIERKIEIDVEVNADGVDELQQLIDGIDATPVEKLGDAVDDVVSKFGELNNVKLPNADIAIEEKGFKETTDAIEKTSDAFADLEPLIKATTTATTASAVAAAGSGTQFLALGGVVAGGAAQNVAYSKSLDNIIEKLNVMKKGFIDVEKIGDTKKVVVDEGALETYSNSLKSFATILDKANNEIDDAFRQMEQRIAQSGQKIKATLVVTKNGTAKIVDEIGRIAEIEPTFRGINGAMQEMNVTITKVIDNNGKATDAINEYKDALERTFDTDPVEEYRKALLEVSKASAEAMQMKLSGNSEEALKQLETMQTRLIGLETQLTSTGRLTVQQIEDISTSVQHDLYGAIEEAVMSLTELGDNVVDNAGEVRKEILMTVLECQKAGVSTEEAASEASAVIAEKLGTEAAKAFEEYRQSAIENLEATNEVIREQSKELGFWGKAFDALPASIKRTLTQLKALIANPYALAIAAITAALNELRNAFKRNDEAMTEFNKSMSGIKAALVTVRKAFDSIVEGIGNVLGYWNKFTASIDGWLEQHKGADFLVTSIIGSTASERNVLREIDEAENEIAANQRENTKRQAELDEDIAKKRLEIAEIDRKIAEGRKKGVDLSELQAQKDSLIDEIEAKKQDKLQASIELKEKQLEQLLKEQSLLANSNEDLQKRAELEAEIVKLRTDIINATTESVNQQTANYRKTTTATVGSDDRDEAKKLFESLGLNEKEKAIKELNDTYDEAKKLLEKYGYDTTRLTRQHYDDIARLRGEWLKGEIDEEKEIEAVTAAYNKEQYNDSMKTYDALISAKKAYYEGIIGVIEEQSDREIAIVGENAEVRLAIATRTADEEYQVLKRSIEDQSKLLEQQLADAMAQGDVDKQVDIEKRLQQLKTDEVAIGVEKRKAILDAENEYADMKANERLEATHGYAVEEARILNEAALEKLDNSEQFHRQEIERLEAELEARKANGLETIDLETEIANEEIAIDEEKNAVKLENEKRLHEAKVAVAKKAAMMELSAAGDLMNALADLYDKGDKTSRRDFERQKKFKIAGATINMLEGVVKAVSGAMELGPIAGPIVGATNSAAVIAAGIANINKIKQTSFESSASMDMSAAFNASGANVSAPQLTTVINAQPVYSQLTDNSAERVTKDQRVYVVYGDIDEAAKYVEVVNDETSF